MFGVRSGWVELSVFLLCVGLGESATRINFPGCDRAGWKCIKVQASPIRYEIEYVCQNTDGIIFSLWNFNAPAEIKFLKVVNCSSVEIDLTCTGVGRQVESLHLKNVGVLNFTNILYKDHAQMPERVILQDIRDMPLIPEKTFKQMKHPLASVHRCAVNTQPLNKVIFQNVNIGKIETYGFYNLTEVKQFRMDNVKVKVMDAMALQVEMSKEESFVVFNSSFDQVYYKAFNLKSPKVSFEQTHFTTISQNAIDTTSFNFNFVNNTIQMVQSFGFILLSQDVTFESNRFHFLKTSALQGIGPGLLENAFMSFGQLQFNYTFSQNTVEHADIAGLNPDWLAYRNVRSYINVSDNQLPCSCKELGWITLRSGLGEEFSDMMTFNSKFLDVNNNNTCLHTPCQLPVTVMVGMNIKFGLCASAEPITSLCKKYKPNQSDLGFGAGAKLVLNKWKKYFSTPTEKEEISYDDIEAFENLFALAQKNENKHDLHFVKHDSKHDSKESYFKIEKTAQMDVDPIEIIKEIVDPVEVSEPNEESTTHPDIYFDDELFNDTATMYKYQLDVRGSNTTANVANSTVNSTANSAGNSTANSAVQGFNKNGSYYATSDDQTGFNTLKKEYETNQKDFLKNSFHQWQAQRKKRMVYFKVYGNLVTLG